MYTPGAQPPMVVPVRTIIAGTLGRMATRMPAMIVRLTVIPFHQAVLEQNVAAAVEERVPVAVSPLHVAVYLAVHKEAGEEDQSQPGQPEPVRDRTMLVAGALRETVLGAHTVMPTGGLRSPTTARFVVV